MSGFNIDRLINLNAFNDELSTSESLALSLPTGTTVDLDFENYYYYYNDNGYNNEDASFQLNKKNNNVNSISSLNKWINESSNKTSGIFECDYFNSNIGLNFNKGNMEDNEVAYNKDFYSKDILPTLLNSNINYNIEVRKDEVGIKKSQVKAIVLFLRANLGIGVANHFKEEVESLGAYVFLAENCKELLEVNNELDGCKRLIVTSADVALNEKLSDEISKKKLTNFLGIVLYCGPHAEYHIKWCSRVSSIKFLSQNLIEVRRAISWLFSESINSTNEMPNIGRRGKKVGSQEVKKPLQNKVSPLVNDFPSLGIQTFPNIAIGEQKDVNSNGHYSPFGRNNSNPHDNIANMFRTLAIETKIATQANNGQFFNIDG